MHESRFRRCRFAIAVVAGALLAGCGPAPAPVAESPAPALPAPAPAPPPPTTVPASPPVPTNDPLPPADGLDLPSRTTAASGAEATWRGADSTLLQAVRIGTQPGADRLVFEFAGEGLPAWDIAYVDQPQVECGSGEPVRLPGDAWLQVRFHGARAHTDAGEGTSGPRRRDVAGGNLRALARICDFEGEVTWIAAVARPDGYTPRVLASPSRLVVDIASD